jgi:hypothetical protein
MYTGLRARHPENRDSIRPLIAQAFRTTGALAIALGALGAIYAVLYLAGG